MWTSRTGRRPLRLRRARLLLIAVAIAASDLVVRSSSFCPTASNPCSRGRRRPQRVGGGDRYVTANGGPINNVGWGSWGARRENPSRCSPLLASSPGDDTPPPPSSPGTLPDYGSTSVEVDGHTLDDPSPSLSAVRRKHRRRDLDGKSLVQQTLSEMSTDVEFRETSERLAALGPRGVTAEERARRRRALDNLDPPVPDFDSFVRSATSGGNGDDGASVQRGTAKVLQINIGLYCNQACGHCHVESSPRRTEHMTSEVAARCVSLLANAPEITTLDITGGAPELNPCFRLLVRTARAARPDIVIIDRCNLTVLHEPGQGADLIEFLRENRVDIVASLPCYSEDNVDEQRGRGVFERSVSALLMLNEAGYGTGGGSAGHKLDLVYNPLGAFLPPPQEKLQEQYKKELLDRFGIEFDTLFTMTNMPIKRFADFLHRRGELEGYMDLLVRNFNPDTVGRTMCTDTISVGYDGAIYDCDFNQQLGIDMLAAEGDGGDTGDTGAAVNGGGSNGANKVGMTVFDIDRLSDLRDHPIATDNHCFGCTAGMGSS